MNGAQIIIESGTLVQLAQPLCVRAGFAPAATLFFERCHYSLVTVTSRQIQHYNTLLQLCARAFRSYALVHMNPDASNFMLLFGLFHIYN